MNGQMRNLWLSFSMRKICFHDRLVKQNRRGIIYKLFTSFFGNISFIYIIWDEIKKENNKDPAQPRKYMKQLSHTKWKKDENFTSFSCFKGLSLLILKGSKQNYTAFETGKKRLSSPFNNFSSSFFSSSKNYIGCYMTLSEH